MSVSLGRLCSPVFAMPQWTDAEGKSSPFPTEAPPTKLISSFDKRKDALLGDVEGDIKSRRVGLEQTKYNTMSVNEMSVTNQVALTSALEGTDLTKSILSHQVAANTVHARELAALQLKLSLIHI